MRSGPHGDDTTRQSSGAAAPSNLLVLAPSDRGQACDLTAGQGPRNVIAVTVSGSPDERIAAWRRQPGGPPAKACIVSAGENTRSAADRTGTHRPAERVGIETVPDAADLAGLGTAVTDRLAAWADEETPTVVCVDSLSAIVDAVDVEGVFRFAHVLTRRVAATGATAHYHLDPEAHDPATVDTLAVLFDDVVDPGDDPGGSSA